MNSLGLWAWAMAPVTVDSLIGTTLVTLLAMDDLAGSPAGNETLELGD